MSGSCGEQGRYQADLVCRDVRAEITKRSDAMLGMGRAKDAKRKTFNENGVKTTSVMA